METLIVALPGFFSVLCFMIICFYIFAVFGVALFGGIQLNGELSKFRSLPHVKQFSRCIWGFCICAVHAWLRICVPYANRVSSGIHPVPVQ